MTEPDPSRPPPPAWQRHIFVTAPRALTAVLILAGIGINFANVISRYLFNFALYWAEEIMVFVIVWCVFIGAVAVAFNGAHLKMDLLSTRLESPWKEFVNGIAAAAFGDVSVTASVPMVIPHSALLIGIVLMVLAVILRWRAYLRGRF